MRSTNKAVASALLVAIAALGCKKDKGSENEPAKADENRAAAAQLTAPPLFAHIPADTPYVLAAFKPFPAGYWKVVGESARSMMEPLLAVLAALPGDEPSAKLARALARDLKGNLNEAGLKKLFGISTASRWALYGVGLVPVLRIELADPAALTGTIERLAAEAGLTLPQKALGGRSYWQFEEDDTSLVVAVADQQLVLAAGPTPMVDMALPFIVGTEKPKPNMADGGAVKETLVRHGFSGFGAGYIDSGKLLNVLTMADFFKAAAGGGMPEACKPKLVELAGRFPRLAIGYDEVSEQATAMRIVLEMDKELVGKLSAMQVEVPGMTGGKLAEPALLAFGAAFDLSKAQALALEFADGLAALGTACDPSLVSDAAEMKEELGKPLHPLLTKVRGGLVTLVDATVSGGQPSGIEGYALLASDDPGGLVDAISRQLPPGMMPAIQRDGAFHQVLPAGAAVPWLGAIEAAVKQKSVVVATGKRGTSGAEAALARTGKAPLLLVTYDYGRMIELGAQAAGPLAGAMPDEVRMAETFGTTAMWAYVSDHGLELGLRMENRK